MASNTTFRGFGPDGSVQLERWGKKVNVPLPAEAIEKLRQACYKELPLKPPPLQPQSYIYYDSDRREVVAQIQPNLVAALNDQLQNSPDDRVKDFVLRLDMALLDALKHLDPKGEPGVDGDGSVESG